MKAKAIFINRELSWLKFNLRVLEEAARPEVPLCERLSFASIYQSNLDEFFMVRVGSLTDQMLLAQKVKDNKTHLTAKEQLKGILAQVNRMQATLGQVYDELMADLAEQGVRLVDFSRLTPGQSRQLESWFDQQLLPLISPTMVGKRQPFPFLRNKDIYAVVVLEKDKLGIIPCGTGVFPRLIAVPGQPGAYMLSEEVILHFIPKAFPGYAVQAKSLLRLTRNADIDADAQYDEDWDYREFMAEVIRRRRRLAPVRLELSRDLDREVVRTLCRYTGAPLKHVVESHIPLDLSFFSQIQDALRQRSQLFYPKRFPQRSPDFRTGQSLFEQIQQGDKLLSYPYESMKPFLELLEQAATDPEVLSIKMTLYRVARQSKVVESLIEAAENGKDVVVLVELKARFDEENNIEWSRQLEEAGCQVIYGLEGYKVHCKLCLITRRHGGKIQYFTQLGTGNYNEQTARLYTDISLLTASQTLGREAAAIFQCLARGELAPPMKHLLVAPHGLQSRVLALIDQQIARGPEGYIGVKLNSLTDKTIIDRLVKASCSGVTIQLLVRGICCLLPGVPGYTENITVTSIVGRYLEHSRLFFFGPQGAQGVYLSSADWMTRNTCRRVEVAAPVWDEDIKGRLWDMFQTMLRDDLQARRLRPDGRYVRLTPRGEGFSSQEYFYAQAYDRAQGGQNGD